VFVRYWGPKADIPFLRRTCPLSAVKRTWRFAPRMSAYDPKRTCDRQSVDPGSGVIFGCATSILPVLFVSPLEAGPTTGVNMTIGRIIAITAVVCAAIGMTTQAEAAKRKTTGRSGITLIGCAYIDLLCGTIMRDFAGNTYALSPPVTPYTPLKVVGRKSGDIPRGWCRATRVQVKSATPSSQSCGVAAR